MTIKSLTLKQKSGLLSPLQSDTIYGHFCWRLLERSGEKALENFIKAYQTGKPVFLLSDALIKTRDGIQFPKPLVYKKGNTPSNKAGKIVEFVSQKTLKEESFLTLEMLEDFIAGKEIRPRVQKTEKNCNKPKKKAVEQSLRVSVQIDRDTFTSAQSKLFSYKPVYSSAETRYVILIKVLDESWFSELDCESILKEVFTTGFGKKKSSGYGHFEIEEDASLFTDLTEPDDGNAFMVFGNFLPAVGDKVTPIGYNINTKIGRLGEEKSLEANPFKNPIAFLTAGSCFQTELNKDFYGRITGDNEIGSSFGKAVQFGMPFFLRFKYQE
ncbi:MAG: hypothetical protein HUU54_10230 [Ignavibacteriaceae bacterium]|nr:hypothetical protein [Ignavibacteriaceae bacterium]